MAYYYFDFRDVKVNKKALAWTEAECEHFGDNHFAPVTIPTIVHTPRVHKKSIPLPTGLFDKVINIFKKKIVQFDFGLIHIPAEKHQEPDGLSRHKPIPGEDDNEDDPEEWVNDYLALGLWLDMSSLA
jgi:hypothetical protein